jgi:acetyltransferase-like isoleucine patch superfamily enzyme
VREAAKVVARGLAAVAVLPAVVSYFVRRPLLGADRALEGSSQAFGLIPGLIGDYLRRGFLTRVLDECAASSTIQFGALFSQAGARIGENVYIGPRCHLGLVELGKDVLLAAGVHVPSGGATHGTGDSERPIREQPGRRTRIHIGEGTWVGSAAVIMADVGRHCVIGAGAVVTHPIPDFSIAVGIPARVIRSRRADDRLTLARR